MPLTAPHFTRPPSEDELHAIGLAVKRQIQPIAVQFQLFSLCMLAVSVALCLYAGVPLRPDLFALLALTGVGLCIALCMAAPASHGFWFICSGPVHALFTALSFRLLSDALPNQDFWLIPLCLLMSFTVATISSGFWHHMVYNLICWAVLTRAGSVSSGAADQDPLLVLLMVVGIGMTSSVCFFIDHSRRKNVLLTMRLERLANFDALTGMRNRRSFLEMVEAATALRGGGGGDTGTTHHFALLDIDNFKRINDTLGHGVGDVVLQRVGRVLLDQCGPRPCGRMGGEEFGILLSGMDGAQAGAFLDGLLIALRRPPVSGPPATASIGLTTLRKGDTLSEFIRRADEALYEAKRAGKNRWHATAKADAVPVRP